MLDTAEPIPGSEWATIDPKEVGMTSEALGVASRTLEGLTTTSFMAVKGGKTAFSYGDCSRSSYLASTRKSILSMLYGKHVESGAIDLNATMDDLGVFEEDGLLPIERSAKLADLLKSCSGVYYPAGSPGSDMKDVPERGSKVPGQYFHYNNWDFNVLGAVFEELTGQTVFQAFEKELAAPLRLQDFDPSRQRLLGYGNRSRYLAYHFFLSCRDMARIGLLMARRGNWGGQQLISKSWVAQSTSIMVPVKEMANPKPRVAGYSYLWWIPEVPQNKPYWKDAFVAAGHFGQFILCMPRLDAVFVNRRAVTDEQAIGRNLGTFTEELEPVTMAQFLGVCDIFADGFADASETVQR